MAVFFKNETVTVTRTSGQTIDANGFYTTGSTSNITVLGSFQPLTGVDRNILPENVKEVATHWFFTTTELMTSDLIEDSAGKKYEVHTVEVWQGFGLGLDHYTCILRYVEGS